MLKRPHYIALSVVVLIVLIFLSLPSSISNSIKLALGGFFLPLFGLSNSARQLEERVGDSFIPKHVLIDELQNLRRENQQLRLQAMQNGQAMEENNRFREALGWQQKKHWQCKLAQVVIRDPASWWRTAQINLGSRDGIKPDMAVMTPEGLVGRVGQVAYSHSQIVLIGDPLCRVSALIKETHDTGVLFSDASGLSDPTIVTLSFIYKGGLKPGNTVVTSGLGGIFPAGIVIGGVVDTRTVNGLYDEATVKLSADLAHLDHVWVLTQ